MGSLFPPHSMAPTVGAGSVIIKDIADGVVAAGVPAKVIRARG